jgi:hypothetical protein
LLRNGRGSFHSELECLVSPSIASSLRMNPTHAQLEVLVVSDVDFTILVGLSPANAASPFAMGHGVIYEKVIQLAV